MTTKKGRPLSFHDNLEDTDDEDKKKKRWTLRLFKSPQEVSICYSQLPNPHSDLPFSPVFSRLLQPETPHPKAGKASSDGICSLFSVVFFPAFFFDFHLGFFNR